MEKEVFGIKKTRITVSDDFFTKKDVEEYVNDKNPDTESLDDISGETILELACTCYNQLSLIYELGYDEMTEELLTRYSGVTKNMGKKIFDILKDAKMLDFKDQVDAGIILKPGIISRASK